MPKKYLSCPRLFILNAAAKCSYNNFVVTHFWVPAQNNNNIQKVKKILSKNNNSEKKGCQNAQKMVKNWLRRFKNTTIKI
jgi:hypothetical protein